MPIHPLYDVVEDDAAFGFVEEVVEKSRVELERGIGVSIPARPFRAGVRARQPVGGPVQHESGNSDSPYMIPDEVLHPEEFRGRARGQGSLIDQRVLIHFPDDFWIAREIRIRGLQYARLGSYGTEEFGKRDEPSRDVPRGSEARSAQDETRDRWMPLEDVERRDRSSQTVSEEEDRGRRMSPGHFANDEIQVRKIVREPTNKGSGSPRDSMTPKIGSFHCVAPLSQLDGEV